MRSVLLRFVRFVPSSPLTRRVGAFRPLSVSVPRIHHQDDHRNRFANHALVGPLAFSACAAFALSSRSSADAPALVGNVSSPDPFVQLRAIEALLAVANDADNHDALVQAGAVDALVKAVRADDKSSAANLSIMRALADLARKDGAHETFLAAGVPDLLARIIRECRVEQSAGKSYWVTEWIWSWFGYRGTAMQQLAQSSSGLLAEPGLLGQSSPPFATLGATPESLTLNIADGIIYHSTRCIANLSRNSRCHGPLLSAGLLDPMIDVLAAAPLRSNLDSASSLAELAGDEQRADTIRFATLSVGALSKTAASEVVARRGHRPLIALLGQSTDSIAQTYAAGGIRNLARHVEDDREGTWKVHRELVIDGVACALSAGLSSSTPQTQVFSVLAVGDILATGHPKARVICNRMRETFEPFAESVKSANASVRRAVYRSLDAIFMNAGDKLDMRLSEVAREKYSSLCAVLTGKVGSIVEALSKKGDPYAINALASLCRDDEISASLVEKGFVPLAVNAMQASGDTGDRAVVALARLSNRPGTVEIIANFGGPKACSKRAKPSPDCRWEAALLANISRDERYRRDVGFSGLSILLRAVGSSDEDARREGSRAFFNLTIGGVSRVLSAQGGALPPLIKIADTTSDAEARRYAVGAIAAISELHEFAAKVVQQGGIKTMLHAAQADSYLSRDVARCYAQLSNHVEAHLALASEGAVEWLVLTASRGDAAADTLYHAVSALCNISYSSGAPHEALRKAGAPSVLTGLASGFYPSHVANCARLALTNLRGGVPPAMQHAEVQGPVDPA